MVRTEFAGGIRRVTGGPGGEVLLITGSEKTFVYDAGMAFCSSQLVENIKMELGECSLDGVLLSHTHYDHVGGIPALRKEWPKLNVYGSAYGKAVLQRQGALDTIRKLSHVARISYANDDTEQITYRDEDMRVDTVVGEGSNISLGNERIIVLETKGHTHCSLSFYLEQASILLASESTGVFQGDQTIRGAVMTSYLDAEASIEACRKLPAKYIFSPHTLQMEDAIVPIYWDLAEAALKELKRFLIGKLEAGLTEEEILDIARDRYWTEFVKKEQPQEAFDVNMRAKIDLAVREFGPF